MLSEEGAAKRRLGYLLDADVSIVDRNQGRSIVDLHAHRDGSLTAVIEVTSLVSGGQRALEAQVGEYTRPAPGLRRSAMFWVGPNLPYERLEHDELTQLASALDRAGVHSDHDLGWGERRKQVPRWLLAAVDAGDIEFMAHGITDEASVTTVPRLSRGGGLPGPEALVPWWRQEFLTAPKPSLSKRIDKLRAAQVVPPCERHLWVLIDLDYVGIGVANVLAFEESVPRTPVRLPTGVDRVWLCTGWMKGGIVEVSGAGWARHPLRAPST